MTYATSLSEDIANKSINYHVILCKNNLYTGRRLTISLGIRSQLGCHADRAMAIE